MAQTWQNTSLIMLRTMLNDAGCDDVRYPPQRLSDLLITGAYFLPLDINFSTDFVVDVEARTITPNPIDQTDGDEFINFMVFNTTSSIIKINQIGVYILRILTHDNYHSIQYVD